MIGHDLRNNRLDFVSDWVKGQGQGHKKVKNVFLRYLSYFLSDLHETNVKISRIQFPIPRYATGYGVVHSFFSGWGQMSRGSRPFKMCVLRYNSVNSGPIWTKATHKFPIFYAPSNSDGRQKSVAKVCLPSAHSVFICICVNWNTCLYAINIFLQIGFLSESNVPPSTPY